MRHLKSLLRALGTLIPALVLVMALAAPIAGNSPGSVLAATDQRPSLPGVPDTVGVVAHEELTLEAGDYQWQATSLPAFADAQAQIQSHRGFLVTVNNSVDIMRTDGTHLRVAGGSALPLIEGEQFAAIEVNGVPADMTIVELPLVADLLPTEQPDQVAPVTLKQGHYILAVLAIPARKPGDPTPGQLLSKSAGAGIAVYPRAAGQATPTVADKNGPFWLVAIFPAPDGSGTPES